MAALPLNSLSSLSPAAIEVILDSPAALSPNGSPPDYTTSNTLRPELYVTLGLCIPLPTLVLAARIYTKYFVIRRLHWEDYSIIVAWIFHIACCGIILAAGPLGAKHLWDTKVRDVFQVLYYANLAEILYNPTILAVKMAILLQYLRIFVPLRRRNSVMFHAIILTMGTMIIFYTMLTFLIIFVCTPRAASWNKLLPGQCLDINAILTSAAAFNLLSDLIILALPQYSIWRRLQMERKHKMGISAIFGLGVVACAVSALRVQSTVQLIQTQDATWYLVPTAIWANTEVALGIICSCLPVMPMFFQTVRGGLTRISRADRLNTSHGNFFTSASSKRSKDRHLDSTGTLTTEKPLSQASQSEPGPAARTWLREPSSQGSKASLYQEASIGLEKPLPAIPHEEKIVCTIEIEWNEERVQV